MTIMSFGQIILKNAIICEQKKKIFFSIFKDHYTIISPGYIKHQNIVIVYGSIFLKHDLQKIVAKNVAF